jgi:hypothetical protein
MIEIDTSADSQNAAQDDLAPETTVADPTVGNAGRGAMDTRTAVIRGLAIMVLVLTIGALLQVFVVGRIQHSASQQRLFDRFRSAAASGTAPVGALDGEGRELPVGAPVAYLEIASIGLNEVVVQGTTPAATFLGPGHRRDTVLPGQIGTSVILGRRSMFGGPFGRLSDLQAKETIKVTTGQGEFTFRVIGTRRAGDPQPAPVAVGGSRLTLVTASGSPYLASGALYLDADLEGTAVGPGPRIVTSATLPAEEQVLAGDSRTLWALALWLQALVVVLVAALWCWTRWGRAQAWVVLGPILLLLSVLVWDELARLFPNLA